MVATPNKVKYGLSNVYYALLSMDENGAVTFDTPRHIPGAVNLNLPPQGDTTTFYADNVAYHVSVANDGYQGDLEIALIPDHFSQDVLKEQLHPTDKVLVENSSVETAPFALLYEFKGDQHGIRHVLYYCTVARPNISGATTTRTKEPQTSTLAITAAPLSDGGVKAKTTADTPEAVYNNWFKNVWVPTLPEAE